MAQVEVETRRFSAEDIRQMLEAGIIAEDEPLELLEGRLVVVTPQDPQHSYVTGAVAQLLRDACTQAFVREEKPIHAGPESLPEPDVALVRGTPREFANRHPGGEDTVLVVEVACTSQAYDREKAETYARAGVPELWLVDIPAQRVEVHTEPQPDGRYRVVQILAGDDELAPLACRLRIPVRSLFS